MGNDVVQLTSYVPALCLDAARGRFACEQLGLQLQGGDVAVRAAEGQAKGKGQPDDGAAGSARGWGGRVVGVGQNRSGQPRRHTTPAPGRRSLPDGVGTDGKPGDDDRPQETNLVRDSSNKRLQDHSPAHHDGTGEWQGSPEQDAGDHQHGEGDPRTGLGRGCR